MQTQKKEVVKASGALHISHTISLLQQQLWNILLARAYPHFRKKREFKLPVSKLFSELDIDGQANWAHVIKALNGLSLKVEYNLLGKDKSSKWGVFHFLEDVYVKDGICFYSYDRTVRDAISSSTMFAKISLAIQKRFHCKYSLFLYELAVDYKGLQQTPWIVLQTFRKYMGLQEEEYISFKLLNFYVIKKAIAEINEKSDLCLGVELNRAARNVQAIRFFIEEKKDTAIPQSIEQPVPQLPISDNQVLLNKLLSYGLTKKKADKIIELFSSEAIAQKIKMMLTSNVSIKNSGAWLLKALEEDWQVKNYDHRAEQEKIKREKLQERQKGEYLAKKLKDLQNEYDAYKDTQAEQLYQTLPQKMLNYVEEAFKLWLVEKRKTAGLFALSEDFYKKIFLKQFLIDKDELNFVKWASAKGYRIEPKGEILQLVE